uniref:Protein phosphatase 1 regulatory subunit 35 n=1 Tax=Macrostomum lignano TaxID=282301 RepID=A0A1I8HD72_9PLAT
ESCSQPVIRQLAEPERTQSEVMGLSRGDRQPQQPQRLSKRAWSIAALTAPVTGVRKPARGPSHPVQRVRLRCISLLSLCEPPEVTTASLFDMVAL